MTMKQQKRSTSRRSSRRSAQPSPLHVPQPVPNGTTQTLHADVNMVTFGGQTEQTQPSNNIVFIPTADPIMENDENFIRAPLPLMPLFFLNDMADGFQRQESHGASTSSPKVTNNASIPSTPLPSGALPPLSPTSPGSTAGLPNSPTGRPARNCLVLDCGKPACRNGPDGSKSLCTTCYFRLGRMILPLYRPANESRLTVVSSEGAKRMQIIDFERSNRKRNLQKPIVEPYLNSDVVDSGLPDENGSSAQIPAVQCSTLFCDCKEGLQFLKDSGKFQVLCRRCYQGPMGGDMKIRQDVGRGAEIVFEDGHVNDIVNELRCGNQGLFYEF